MTFSLPSDAVEDERTSALNLIASVLSGSQRLAHSCDMFLTEGFGSREPNFSILISLGTYELRSYWV